MLFFADSSKGARFFNFFRFFVDFFFLIVFGGNRFGFRFTFGVSVFTVPVPVAYCIP